jgi:hypothetical protein
MVLQIFLLFFNNSEISVNKKIHSPIAIPVTGVNTVSKFMEARVIPKETGWKNANIAIIVLITAIAIVMDITFSIMV